MDRQMYMALCKRKQLLEAQINEYQFVLNSLEDNRLLIRTSLSANSVLSFWDNSREILNRHIRTHMALIPEYYWVLSRLEKLNKIHTSGRSVGSDPSAPI